MVRTTCNHEDEQVEEDSSDEDGIAEEIEDGDDFMDDGELARSVGAESLVLDEFELNKMSITPKSSSFIYRFEGQGREPARMPSKIRPSMSPEL